MLLQEKEPLIGKGTEREQVDALWDAYDATQSEAARNALVENYMIIVKYQAERVAAKLPDSVDVEDLKSAGVFGLMDAIRAFDRTRGVKFETYCVPRIRGAMLDELRAMDWVPRLVRSRVSKLNEATKELDKRLGRSPTIEELAGHLDMSVDDTENLQREANVANLISLSKKWFETDSQKDVEEAHFLEDSKAPSPHQRFDQQAFMSKILAGCNRSERLLILLYYYEGITMKEIGKTLDLSESRVSQMHTALMGRLTMKYLWEDGVLVGREHHRKQQRKLVSPLLEGWSRDTHTELLHLTQGERLPGQWLYGTDSPENGDESDDSNIAGTTTSLPRRRGRPSRQGSNGVGAHTNGHGSNGSSVRRTTTSLPQRRERPPEQRSNNGVVAHTNGHKHNGAHIETEVTPHPNGTPAFARQQTIHIPFLRSEVLSTIQGDLPGILKGDGKEENRTVTPKELESMLPERVIAEFCRDTGELIFTAVAETPSGMLSVTYKSRLADWGKRKKEETTSALHETNDQAANEGANQQGGTIVENSGEEITQAPPEEIAEKPPEEITQAPPREIPIQVSFWRSEFLETIGKGVQAVLQGKTSSVDVFSDAKTLQSILPKRLIATMNHETGKLTFDVVCPTELGTLSFKHELTWFDVQKISDRRHKNE